MAITLRPYQKDMLACIRQDWRDGMRRLIVSAATGTGKCLPRETLVWSDGLRDFGDLLAENVSVIRAPEQMRPINGWHEDGVRDGLRVTTDCGLEIDGTFDHPIWVRTAEGFEGWRKLSELTGKEYVAVARGRADWGSLVFDEEDAYLAGLAVADGMLCVSANHDDRFQIDKHPVVLATVQLLMRDWASRAGCRSERLPTIHEKSPRHGFISVTAKRMGAWLREAFGLTLGPSETRSVPVPILRSNRATVRAFLRGYFAGDGDAWGAVEVTSTSKRLLDQVQQLLLGLGVWAALRPRKSEGHPTWRLTVRDTDAFAREIGIGHPGTVKSANYERLLARDRNTNRDVVPGVRQQIQQLRASIMGNRNTGLWKVASSYARGDRMPSYEALRKMVAAAPPSEARAECERVIRENYAWSSIRSIQPSTRERIDCEVAEEHAFIGNGVVNHNTWCFVFIIWAARQNGLRCCVLVNTDELVQQTVEKLKRVGVDPGIIKAGRNEWMRDVVVASIQTLSKASRLYNLPPNHFGVVITDECHYANAPSYQRVLWYFADAWHLGVTATPFRGDKRSVAGAGWNKVSYVYTMQDAIRDGWLAPCRFVQVNTGVELGKLTKSKATLTSGPDFNAKMLEKMINTPERNAKIVEAALEHLVESPNPLSARMRRTVGFCAGVDHAVDLANAFRHRGVESFAVYGSMKEKHRRLLLKAHRMGRFPVLTNCNILTHGYDDPAIEAIIMARPTESKVLYIQEIGRGLRRSEETGKRDCIVLDVVDVMKKHTMTIGKELLELGEAIEEQGKAPPVKPPVVEQASEVESVAEGTDFESEAAGLIPVGDLKGVDPDDF